MSTKTKKHFQTHPSFFDRYIDRIPDIEINTALREFGPNLLRNELDMLKKIGEHIYAPNKWTIKQIIQHLIDTERIFQYRALRFARHDETVLPGFDEELFAQHAPVAHRTIEDLLDEFELVRKSSILLYASFDGEALDREGSSYNSTLTVGSTAYILGGHIVHHLSVIKERYLHLA
jgi:hypothetical protein